MLCVVRGEDRDQGTGVADDHSGAPEAFGKQILVVAAEIVPSTGEGREPRWRPGGRGLLLVLTASLGEDGGNTVAPADLPAEVASHVFVSRE